MTEDRVPDPVYILGEATRRPITLDEYEVVRSALRSEQPAPPLDVAPAYQPIIKALTYPCREPMHRAAAEALARLVARR